MPTPCPAPTRALPPTLLAAALALAGCDASPPAPAQTPTPAPTPTATAAPLAIADDLRARVEAPPVPVDGAPCGVVDVLDAPMGPPDGDGYHVRWPYGRASRRYGGQQHAGEDWLSRRGPTLGHPVHAIGHGQVTYAQPLGWGTDQGVVIVRHVAPGGDSFLSFYGHMEPTSITLTVGACVVRGQRIAAVGKPRTSPHLHFEIRTHLPTTPGPGYWPSDPASQGWRPPSAFIVGERLRTAPGVLWTAELTGTHPVAAGPLPDDTLVLLQHERRLTGLGMADGAVRWTEALTEPARAAAADAAGDLLYLALRGGGIRALALSPDGPATWWTAEPAAGLGASPLLVPLPGGGVAVHDGARLIGLGRDGARAWEAADVPEVAGWALDGRRLVVAPRAERARGGGVRPRGAAGASGTRREIGGIELAVLPLPGRPLPAGDGVLVYGPGGVWRAAGAGGRAELRYALDEGLIDDGSIVGAPDGGAIVAHRDPRSMRLISLDASGLFRWDRALPVTARRMPRVVAAGGRVLVAVSTGELLQVDPATGDARRLLAPSAPESFETPWAAWAPDGRVVVRVGDRLIGFDPARVAP